jgi:enoyl-CoA hydratase
VNFDNLIVERDGPLAVITLNRAPVLNALNIPLLTDLDRAVDLLGRADDVRALIITGAGDKAFAAGADIRELSALSASEARSHSAFGQAVFSRVEHIDKPVIAAVNGFALGGGFELALSCSLRIAAESARVGLPEISLGLIPGFGATQRLPRLVGRGRALDLLLTGRVVSSSEALAMGLVDRVVAPGDLLSVARATGAELASKPRHAVRFILEAVRNGTDVSIERGLELESALFALVSNTPDAKEGTRAFLEKRTPRFT